MKIADTNVLEQHHTSIQIFFPHLETSESVLELVGDVLIGDPAHVQVAFEGLVSVFNSFSINQILQVVTGPDLLLSKVSVVFYH